MASDDYEEFRYPSTLGPGVQIHLAVRPIESTAEDQLDHSVHAERLAQMVSALADAPPSAASPNTISLLGGFGVGKSGIGKLLEKKLRNENPLIRLSAWKHRDEGLQWSLLRQARSEISAFLNRKPEEILRDVAALRQSLSRSRINTDDLDDQTARMTRAFSAVLRSQLKLRWWYAVAFAVGIAGVVGFMFEEYTLGAASILFSALGTVITAMFGGAFSLQKEFLKPGIETTVLTVSADLDQFEEKFHAIVAELAKSDPNLKPVFFIDDLDRQSFENIPPALDIIRSVTEIGDCIFIIACDEDRVRAALKKSHPNASSATIADYIQRYFPHPHRLPVPTRRDMSRFASETLKANPDFLLCRLVKHGLPIQRVLDVLIHEGVTTPRAVTRALNEYADQLWLAKEFEAVGRLEPNSVTDYPLFLAKMVTLRLDFPELWKRLEMEEELPQWIVARSRDEIDEHRAVEITSATDEYFVEGTGEARNEHAGLVRFLLHTHLLPSPPVLGPFLCFSQTGYLRGSSRARELVLQIEGDQRGALRTSVGPHDGELVQEVLLRRFRQEKVGVELVSTALLLFSKVPDSRRRDLANAWSEGFSKLEVSDLKKIDFEASLDVLSRADRHVTTQSLLRRLDAGLAIEDLLTLAGKAQLMLGDVNERVRAELNQIPDAGAEDQQVVLLASAAAQNQPDGIAEVLSSGFMERLVNAACAEVANQNEQGESTGTRFRFAGHEETFKEAFKQLVDVTPAPTSTRSALVASTSSAGYEVVSEHLAPIAKMMTDEQLQELALNLVTTARVSDLGYEESLEAILFAEHIWPKNVASGKLLTQIDDAVSSVLDHEKCPHAKYVKAAFGVSTELPNVAAKAVEIAQDSQEVLELCVAEPERFDSNQRESLARATLSKHPGWESLLQGEWTKAVEPAVAEQVGQMTPANDWAELSGAAARAIHFAEGIQPATLVAAMQKISQYIQNHLENSDQDALESACSIAPYLQSSAVQKALQPLYTAPTFTRIGPAARSMLARIASMSNAPPNLRNFLEQNIATLLSDGSDYDAIAKFVSAWPAAQLVKIFGAEVTDSSKLKSLVNALPPKSAADFLIELSGSMGEDAVASIVDSLENAALDRLAWEEIADQLSVNWSNSHSHLAIATLGNVGDPRGTPLLNLASQKLGPKGIAKALKAYWSTGTPPELVERVLGRLKDKLSEDTDREVLLDVARNLKGIDPHKGFGEIRKRLKGLQKSEPDFWRDFNLSLPKSKKGVFG